MKRIVYILLFMSCFASAQETASNKPELAEQLFNGFIENAEARGIEVRGRLATVNKILFLLEGNSHLHKEGVCTIRLNPDVETNWELKRKFLHELGHHFGLKDCRECTYNIMTWYQNGKSAYLFNDEAVRRLYIDLYFEQLRNPSMPHIHY